MLIPQWLRVELSAEEPATDGEFQSIFDGHSLQGWDGDKEHWSVLNGAIMGKTTSDNPLKENTFLIWRGEDGKASVSDFDLRLKIRIHGGNSGIQFRGQEPNRWTIAGYQADFDAANQWTGILYDERGRGVLATRGQRVTLAEGKSPEVNDTQDEKAILAAVKMGEWNEYRILAEGHHIRLYLNGILSVDVTDNDEKNRDMSGLLALQLHQGPPMTIEFKDIKIKSLGDAAQPAASGNLQSNTQGGRKKKIVFIAGTPSHGYGAHEHYAGSLLLARRLEAAQPNFDCQVTRNGWPDNAAELLADADVIVMYADGGKAHPVLPHLDEINKLVAQGVGIACLHYAVEVPAGPGGQAFLDWIGGYFEIHHSVNPHWTAEFQTFVDHPVTRGVEPFSLDDEWYFNMRFREGMQGVTPILSAVPPEVTMARRDGTHSGNPQVRAMVAAHQPQHVAWVCERADGGRGFGFTGGHFHWNWGDDNCRRIVLNALVWLAQSEVPAGGVEDQPVSVEQLEENQDYPKPEKNAS